MEVIQFIIGIISVIALFFFVYVSSVIVHEQKTGKPYRMFWEKNNNKRKLFDKSDLEYKDGDNT